MKNLMNDIAAQMVKAAAEQSNQITNEVNSAVELNMQADQVLELAEKAAEEKHREADEIILAAQRKAQTLRSEANTVLLGVCQQLAAGQMVTGSTAAPQLRNSKTKPKLVGDEEAA